MLGFRWRAPSAGALAFLLALLIAWWLFQADVEVLAIASAKGLSLALFVLAIIWASVLLYNVIEGVGAMEVIGRRMAHLTRDSLPHSLLLAWAFSGFVQGVTGFGVPVAVVVPLMVMVGVRPMVAVVAVLIGHSWAVTFGSLGSSYYSIQLVTGIPGEEIAPTMALLFALPIVTTGLAVAHVAEGVAGVRRSAGVVLVAGAAMAVSTWGMAVLGAPQLASVVAGLVGCLAIWAFSQVPVLVRRGGRGEEDASDAPIEQGTSVELGFHTAFLPYYLLVVLTVGGQLGPVQQLLGHLRWELDYPSTITSLGLLVPAVEEYAAISLLTHPAPIILVSLLATVALLTFRGLWNTGLTWRAVERTYHQSVSPTLGVVTMVMMALVMIHAGMTEVIARGLALVAGGAFPLISPFIGLLGAFMTGSNTNSNVMFGALQVETARALGMSAVVVASIQSIGGSVGSAVTPAKVLLSTALVGLSRQEGDILRRALLYTLVLVLLVGIEGLVVVYLLWGTSLSYTPQ